jgi:hypothetical protein
MELPERTQDRSHHLCLNEGDRERQRERRESQECPSTLGLRSGGEEAARQRSQAEEEEVKRLRGGLRAGSRHGGPAARGGEAAARTWEGLTRAAGISLRASGAA